MKCPFCGESDTQVLESRSVVGGRTIRRRRKCLRCNKRFTTYEQVKHSVLWVIKKDGAKEFFDREKIKRGVLRAVEKRPISQTQVDKLVDEVEQEMLKKESEEIYSRQIGKAVMKRLKRLDKVAWLRFASVYLEFEDLSDFEKAIERKNA